MQCWTPGIRLYLGKLSALYFDVTNQIIMR